MCCGSGNGDRGFAGGDQEFAIEREMGDDLQGCVKGKLVFWEHCPPFPV